MIKIAIIHFHPLEKYPPVMNMIDDISKLDQIFVTVYTTKHKNNNWFAADQINIKRVATLHKNSFMRYRCYVRFNIITFFNLLIEQPNIIIAYETYSLLPVYFYKKLFIKTKIFIHYHEYISQKEILNASLYFEILYFFAKKLYLNCDYISQTNEDRLQLFLNDYPEINKNKVLAVPNLPPNNWLEYSKLNKQENNSGIVKLVHVGSIDLDNMYVREMVDWVLNQNGKYTLDFYSNNISKDAQILLDNLKSESVRLMDAINYFELPEVLINYNIGVTLYNGHIPNYVFNIPNKVYEYLACGLDVWYSKDLISTDQLNKKVFSYIENIEIPTFLRKLNFVYSKSNENLLISHIIRLTSKC